MSEFCISRMVQLNPIAPYVQIALIIVLGIVCLLDGDSYNPLLRILGRSWHSLFISTRISRICGFHACLQSRSGL